MLIVMMIIVMMMIIIIIIIIIIWGRDNLSMIRDRLEGLEFELKEQQVISWSCLDRYWGPHTLQWVARSFSASKAAGA